MKLKAIFLATLLAMVTLPANAETSAEPQEINLEVGQFTYLFGLGQPKISEKEYVYSANVCDQVDKATFSVQQLISNIGNIDPMEQKTIQTVIQIANSATGTVTEFTKNLEVDETNMGKWLNFPVTISVDDKSFYKLTATTTATTGPNEAPQLTSKSFTTYLNFDCESVYDLVFEQIPDVDPDELNQLAEEIGGYVISCLPESFDGVTVANNNYGTKNNFFFINIGPLCESLQAIENIPLDECYGPLSTMCQEEWNPCHDALRIPQNPCQMLDAALKSNFEKKEEVEDDDTPPPPGPEDGECRNAASTAGAGEWAINLMQEEIEAMEPVEETGIFMGVGDIQIDWGDSGEIVQHICYDPGAITIHPDSYEGSNWDGYWGQCGATVLGGLVTGAIVGGTWGAVAGAPFGPFGVVPAGAAGAVAGAASGVASGILTCTGQAIWRWWQDEGWIHCYGDPEASTTWSDPGFTSDLKDLLPTSLLTLSASATGEGYRRIHYGEVLYEGKNYQKGIDTCESQLQASRDAAYAAYLDWGVQTTQGTGTISATLQLIPLGTLIAPLSNVEGSDDLFLSESHGLVVGCDDPLTCPLTLELSLDCNGPVATKSENPGEVTLLFNGGVEGIIPNEIDVPSPVGALPFIDPGDALRPISVNAASGLVPCENVSVSIGGDTPTDTNGGILPILLRGEFETGGDSEKTNDPMGIVEPFVDSANKYYL